MTTPKRERQTGDFCWRCRRIVADDGCYCDALPAIREAQRGMPAGPGRIIGNTLLVLFTIFVIAPIVVFALVSLGLSGG